MPKMLLLRFLKMRRVKYMRELKQIVDSDADSETRIVAAGEFIRASGVNARDMGLADGYRKAAQSVGLERQAPKVTREGQVEQQSHRVAFG